MTVLTRWDPLQEALELRRTMNEFMERSGTGASSLQQFDIEMDIYETPDSYEIEAAMPGIKPEDVDITLNNNVLTIRGETTTEEKEDKNYHLRERRTGSFIRSITLPSLINSDAIDAQFDNGILKLRLPKAEEAKPKHIDIKANGNSSKSMGHKSKSSS